MGSIGQGNYAAAKAAIALLTVQQAAELGEEGFIHYAWNESAGEWQEVPERPEGHWWSEEDWAWYPPMPNDGQHYVWNNETKEWDVDNSAPNAGE